MRTKGGHLVASAIVSELERADKSVGWLSARSGIDHIALVSKLQGDEDFTIVDLANIAAALDVSASTLTPSEQSSDC